MISEITFTKIACCVLNKSSAPSFVIGYRSQFDVRTTDVTGTIIPFPGDDENRVEWHRLKM